MKLARIIDPRFQTALNKLQQQPLPLRAAFKLKGIVSKVAEEGKKYEEVRQAALQRLGDKDDKGQIIITPENTISLSADNMTTFAKEMSDLNMTDVEIPSIKISELNDNMQLSAEDVGMLDGLVVE